MSSADAWAAQPVGAAEVAAAEAGADWGMARVSRPEVALPLGSPVPGALEVLGALAAPGALATPGGPAGAPEVPGAPSALGEL